MTNSITRRKLHTKELLPLTGAPFEVPLVTGETHRYVNLDYAASASALKVVVEAVNEAVEWYSSVHRGAGYKSWISTAAYEGAREAVASFFNARHDDALVFTRNTTDSINLVAGILPADTTVFAFEIEHHANLLPWRRRDDLEVVHLPVPDNPDAVAEVLDDAIQGCPGPGFVSVTGASNVTGDLWPIESVVEVAHNHGAPVLLDAAQLAPHHRIDMEKLGVDYLVASGHKLYAPYGAGVLVGRPDWLASADAYLSGGGAVEFVTLDDVLWTHSPERHEAGSPNVIGAVAMGVACDALGRVGMDMVFEDEKALVEYATEVLSGVPDLEMYRLWSTEHPRVGIVSFNLSGYDHALLAAILSSEYGIGVRHGCFCAHPLMLKLLNIDESHADDLRQEIRSGSRPFLPGAVRASFGLGVTKVDLDYLAEALATIAAEGPQWSYRQTEYGDYVPAPDRRTVPDLPFRLVF